MTRDFLHVLILIEAHRFMHAGSCDRASSLPTPREAHTLGAPVFPFLMMIDDRLEPVCYDMQVAVIGPPRSLPHVKHTRWVQERKPLEQQKPKDCAEVWLCLPLWIHFSVIIGSCVCVFLQALDKCCVVCVTINDYLQTHALAGFVGRSGGNDTGRPCH